MRILWLQREILGIQWGFYGFKGRFWRSLVYFMDSKGDFEHPNRDFVLKKRDFGAQNTDFCSSNVDFWDQNRDCCNQRWILGIQSWISWIQSRIPGDFFEIKRRFWGENTDLWPPSCPSLKFLGIFFGNLTWGWAGPGCTWGWNPGEHGRQTCRSCCWCPPARASCRKKKKWALGRGKILEFTPGMLRIPPFPSEKKKPNKSGAAIPQKKLNFHRIYGLKTSLIL